MNNEQDLINIVFNNSSFGSDPEWLVSRCIIYPTDAELDRINVVIIRGGGGFREKKNTPKQRFCRRIEHRYLIEFINSLRPSGMPPHKLTLEKNNIVMLLQNLDPTNRNYNGTRYIMQHLHQHVIDAVIACEPHSGKRIFIPRIPVIPSENVFPFHMNWSVVCRHEQVSV